MRIPLVSVTALSLVISGCASFFLPTKEMERVSEQGIPVFVDVIRSYRPNSAGGVDVRIEYANASGRTIKYAIFDFVPYDAVGEKLKSSVGGHTVGTIRDVGPIKRSLEKGIWENVWYNHSIECVEMVRAKIVYMNDEEDILEGERLRKAIDRFEANSCEVEA